MKTTSPYNRGIMAPDGYRSNLDAIVDLLKFGPGIMNNSEFIVLLFHVERITLVGRETDQHSRKQALHGIYNMQQGRWIRGPVGVKKSTWIRSNKALIKRGLIRTYELRLKRHDGIEYEVVWPAIAKAIDEWKRVQCETIGLIDLEPYAKEA